MSTAILFDCDGVLVDSETLGLEVELAVLQEIGLHYDRKEFAIRFMGTSDEAFFAALEKDGFEKLGRPISAEIREQMGSRKAALADHLTEVPGALAAVSAMRQLKAVASSSTTLALEYKLKYTGLWNYFAPHVYSADQVAQAKPAPDLFLHAAIGLDVSPIDCLVIEDSINGVIAAKAAGMRVWGFLGGGHTHIELGNLLAAAGAERIMSDWTEAIELLDQEGCLR